MCFTAEDSNQVVRSTKASGGRNDAEESKPKIEYGCAVCVNSVKILHIKSMETWKMSHMHDRRHKHLDYGQHVVDSLLTS
jgi:hypothetical protein